jgi:hypothetical protein
VAKACSSPRILRAEAHASEAEGRDMHLQ